VQGLKRRLLYVSSYEVLAIALSGLLLYWLSSSTGGSSFAVACAASALSVTWNLVYSYGFERWEQWRLGGGEITRTLLTRIIHAVGFEAGLLVFLVPVIAWSFGISLREALLIDIGLLVFFVIYTFVFNWLFDLAFGLPAGKLPRPQFAQHQNV
jgi:uncharacterized membrane protein